MRLALLRASHPEPAVAVTAVTGLLTVGAGLPAARAVAVTATVAASQLAVGWCNDAIDAPRDALVGRRDKPIAVGAISRRTVAIAGVSAAVATVALAFTAGPAAAPVALVGLASALLYNWPLKSTVVSVLPYAVSFAALPAFVLLARPDPHVPGWLVAAGGLLGAGAHFANAIPDLADDSRTGVRGLPHRLGPRVSLVVGAVLLLAATAVLVVGPPGPPSPMALATAGIAAVVLPIGGYAGLLRAPGSRLPFRAVMLVVLLDAVLLVAGGVVG